MYALWLIFIGIFALLYALHLRADFPNHSPWTPDWAKYTDEGWYGNAAIRAHLFGNWYLPGDFSPAPAVPLWPFLEWLLFFFTGVSIEAARGLAVAFFFLNLLLSYLLLRTREPLWVALLALTLIVTSPFLYCFSRLAILEPLLIALTLAALNLAVRLPRMRCPAAASVLIGLLFTLMLLTKTTAAFLLPALAWVMLLPLWRNRKQLLRCLVSAAVAAAASLSLWIGVVICCGHFADYKYFFAVNKFIKPPEFYWPLVSAWWSIHGGLWIDRTLFPLALLVALGAILAGLAGWNEKARKLLLSPVFGASILAAAGYIFFMAFENHPQPRYFAVVAFFSFIIVAQAIGALLTPEIATEIAPETPSSAIPTAKILGWTIASVAALAAAFNAYQTANYAAHPEYTFVEAAQQLTQYIDAHPNGKRLLLSISGDEITLVTHLPSLCDDFSMAELPDKMDRYQPGWYASWNDVDPSTLEDIHIHFSLEQVASYHTYDSAERNVLVLFKLHPLAGGQVRDPEKENLQQQLPDDKFLIDVD
jgi:4-amino-4-deoxy-L-arabinose transferase-like glycosyltransferase